MPLLGRELGFGFGEGRGTWSGQVVGAPQTPCQAGKKYLFLSRR